MALHSLKFDDHKIVLRDLTCSECSIDAFCDDCKTLKQIDKTNVITPEKGEYLDLMDIENTGLTITKMLSSMMMMIKVKLMNQMNQMKMKRRKLILVM